MIKHIVVTQEHIDKGVPEEGSNCPVYFAIDAVCPSVVHVAFEDVQFIVDEDDYEWGYLPDEVNERITAFDSGEGMEPFEFDLDVPDNVSCS